MKEIVSTLEDIEKILGIELLERHDQFYLHLDKNGNNKQKIELLDSCRKNLKAFIDRNMRIKPTFIKK